MVNRVQKRCVLLQLLLDVSFSSELSFEWWSLRPSAAHRGHSRENETSVRPAQLP